MKEVLYEVRCLKSNEDMILALAKAYSLCKIVTLGQKLEFQKTCQNLFQK